MSAGHTPGSIRYDFEPGYCGELIASNGTLVATFNDEPSEEDARRLVACWNVCEGMSTQSLELMPGQFFKPQYQRLLDVETQRDELLAALQMFVFPHNDSDTHTDTERQEIGRTAIAKISGVPT